MIYFSAFHNSDKSSSMWTEQGNDNNDDNCTDFKLEAENNLKAK